MLRTQVQQQDTRLDKERRLEGRGSALVKFEYLRWNEYVKRNKAKRQPDREHVDRLRRIYSKGGCRPLAIGHHIPAIVSEDQLQLALKDAQEKGRWKKDNLPSNLTAVDTQDGYPELVFPDGIECLDGLHRIQAGKEWGATWWIVDLYLSDISYELTTVLNEDHSNKEHPCDGEIYRKIRHYQSLPTHADCPISPAICNRLLAASFDGLSKIEGVFDAGMMVTTLNKVMATKAYEEILHYNSDITSVWAGFFRGVENGFQRVDKAIVKMMEFRAPGISEVNAQLLQGPVLRGSTFSGFSKSERETIWNNILALKGIIPSLTKFFQDVNFLQACVDSIKWLITVPSDQTLSTSLRHAFSPRNTQLIQTSDTTYRHETGDSEYCMRLGYLQLFVFVIRECKSLPKAPGKKISKEMPRATADRDILQRLALFAKQLGFDSPEINSLCGNSSPPTITTTAAAVPLPISRDLSREDVKRRCGRPRIDTFKEDKNYLFLDNLCGGNSETDNVLTSFFILKSWFFGFFGPWPEKLLIPVENSYQSSFRPGEEILETEPRAGQTSMELGERDTADQPDETAGAAEHFPEDENPGGMTELDLFVSQTPTEASDTVEIHFVKRAGNEVDMLDSVGLPGSPYIVEVAKGDPMSIVTNTARDLLAKGLRVCDKHKKYIPSEDCYNVATNGENENTLFLIPDTTYVNNDRRLQLGTNLEPRSQGLEDDMRNTQEVQKVGDQHPVGTEQSLTEYIYESPETEESDEDGSVLDNEVANAANSRVMEDTTVTLRIKAQEDTGGMSGPTINNNWETYMDIAIPIGDPHGLVETTLRDVWEKAHLKPYNYQFRALDYDQCYQVAQESPEHAIYLMASSLQTDKEKNAQLSLYIKASTTSRVRKQKLKGIGLLRKGKMLTASQKEKNKPTGLSHIEQEESVRSQTTQQQQTDPDSSEDTTISPEVHRDKIRIVDNEGAKMKHGISFQSPDIRIRRIRKLSETIDKTSREAV